MRVQLNDKSGQVGVTILLYNGIDKKVKCTFHWVDNCNGFVKKNLQIFAFFNTFQQHFQFAKLPNSKLVIIIIDA